MSGSMARWNGRTGGGTAPSGRPTRFPAAPALSPDGGLPRPPSSLPGVHPRAAGVAPRGFPKDVRAFGHPSMSRSGSSASDTAVIGGRSPGVSRTGSSASDTAVVGGRSTGGVSRSGSSASDTASYRGPPTGTSRSGSSGSDTAGYRGRSTGATAGHSGSTAGARRGRPNQPLPRSPVSPEGPPPPRPPKPGSLRAPQQSPTSPPPASTTGWSRSGTVSPEPQPDQGYMAMGGTHGHDYGYMAMSEPQSDHSYMAMGQPESELEPGYMAMSGPEAEPGYMVMDAGPLRADYPATGRPIQPVSPTRRAVCPPVPAGRDVGSAPQVSASSAGPWRGTPEPPAPQGSAGSWRGAPKPPAPQRSFSPAGSWRGAPEPPAPQRSASPAGSWRGATEPPALQGPASSAGSWRGAPEPPAPQGPASSARSWRAATEPPAPQGPASSAGPWRGATEPPASQGPAGSWRGVPEPPPPRPASPAGSVRSASDWQGASEPPVTEEPLLLPSALSQRNGHLSVPDRDPLGSTSSLSSIGSSTSLQERAFGGDPGAGQGRYSAESDPGGSGQWPWYHQVKRGRAEELLRHRADGWFLVRPTSKPGAVATLSVALAGSCRHLPVRRRQDGRLALGVPKDDETAFDALELLVEFHREHPLVVRGVDSTRLTRTP